MAEVSVEYDREADVLYVRLAPHAKVAKTHPLDDMRLIDYSEDGAVVGMSSSTRAKAWNSATCRSHAKLNSSSVMRVSGCQSSPDPAVAQPPETGRPTPR